LRSSYNTKRFKETHTEHRVHSWQVRALGVLLVQPMTKGAFEISPAQAEGKRGRRVCNLFGDNAI
jgi:hypothetical protein